jgi:hypothetical protein
MKKITNAITKIIKKETNIVPLGRWNIDYCNKKVNNKVDLSNEDHCGPCGQYVIQKNDTTTRLVHGENKQVVK